MRKIIITGGLGHIGSYIIRKLLINEQGIHIIIIDNIKSERYVSLFNLKTKNNKVSFCDIDIAKSSISSVVGKASIIIHLAAITDAENSVGKKKIYLENNLKATMEVIRFSNKFKIPLIFPSSTSVYGKAEINETLFEDNPKVLFPQSPYAIVKLMEENYIKKNAKNLKYFIIRLGTIVGNSIGMRFHTAVNKFCFQASTNREITVWRSAHKQLRPYASLEDFYRLVVFLIKNKNLINNQVYNLVTKNLTVKEIIDIIKIRKKVKIKFVNSKIMNQLSYKVSNQKIKKIGFMPKGNLKKEIIDTLKIFNLVKN
jgi:UDP-glucose 4-epimerase